MSEFGHGSEREHLRIHVLLQVEHEAKKSRRLRADANACDIGIVRLHMRREIAKLRRRIDACKVEHDAIRLAQHDKLMLDRYSGFENQARIFLRRPQSRGRNAAHRHRRPRIGNQELRRRNCDPRQDAPAFQRNGSQTFVSGRPNCAAIASTHRLPAGEYACAVSVRPTPAGASASEIATSARGRNAPACSGHSIRQTLSGRKHSASPAVSHSTGSAKR